MLTCVYHPIDDMRVVEEDEAEKLLASGAWFDSPLKARDYLIKVENEIKQEEEAAKLKPKQKGKDHEKSSSS
jgi:hypothetical protein